MFAAIGAAADGVRRRAPDADGVTHRRILLLAVAALLSVSALLAIGILLAGRFGETEQRILATTMLLAGYGVLGLPSVVLLDQARFRALSAAAALLPAVAAAIALASVWSGSDSETLGRTVGTATVLAVAAAQTAAIAARRRDDDPASVRRLFAAACVLAPVAAAAAIALIWTLPDDPLYPRLFGALVVLDLLVVALQPVLARARLAQPEHRFSVVLADGRTVEVEVAGGDVASAAARAIRAAERAGGHVVRLDVDGGVAPTIRRDGARTARAASRASRAG